MAKGDTDDTTPAKTTKAAPAPKGLRIGTTGVVTLKDGRQRPATITSDPLTRPMVGTDKAQITHSAEWKGCQRASVHFDGSGWVDTIVSIDEPRDIGDIEADGGYVPAFHAH